MLILTYRYTVLTQKTPPGPWVREATTLGGKGAGMLVEGTKWEQISPMWVGGPGG